MKKYLIIFTILILSLPGLSRANTVEFEKEIEETVSELERAFEPVELYVIDIKDSNIILEKGKTALNPGMELALAREGKDYVHPITGEFLGRFEETLGDVIISQVKEDSYIATPLGFQADTARRGDIARISARKIKVAVWDNDGEFKEPPDDNSLIRKFIFKLEASGRFELVPYDIFIAAIKKGSIDKNKRQLSIDELQYLGKNLGIKGIIIPALEDIQGERILKTRFLSINGNVLAEVIKKVPVSAKR